MSTTSRIKFAAFFLAAAGLLAIPFAFTAAPLVGCGAVTSSLGAAGGKGTAPTGGDGGGSILGGSLTVTVSAPTESLSSLSSSPKSLTKLQQDDSWQGPTPDAVVAPVVTKLQVGSFPAAGANIPVTISTVDLATGLPNKVVATTTTNASGTGQITLPPTTVAGPTLIAEVGANKQLKCYITGGVTDCNPVLDAAGLAIRDAQKSDASLSPAKYLAELTQIAHSIDTAAAAQGLKASSFTSIPAAEVMLEPMRNQHALAAMTDKEAGQVEEPILSDITVANSKITFKGSLIDGFDATTDHFYYSGVAVDLTTCKVGDDKAVTCTEPATASSTSGPTYSVVDGNASNVVYVANGDTVVPTITSIDDAVVAPGATVAIHGIGLKDATATVGTTSATIACTTSEDCKVTIPSDAPAGGTTIQLAKGDATSNPAAIFTDSEIGGTREVILQVRSKAGGAVQANCRGMNGSRFAFEDDFGARPGRDAEAKLGHIYTATTDASGDCHLNVLPGQNDFTVTPIADCTAATNYMPQGLSITVEAATATSADAQKVAVTVAAGNCNTVQIIDDAANNADAALFVHGIQEQVRTSGTETFSITKGRNDLRPVNLETDSKGTLSLVCEPNSGMRLFFEEKPNRPATSKVIIPPQEAKLACKSAGAAQTVTLQSGVLATFTAKNPDGKAIDGDYEVQTFRKTDQANINDDTRVSFIRGATQAGAATLAIFKDSIATGNFRPHVTYASTGFDKEVSGTDTALTVTAQPAVSITGTIVDAAGLPLDGVRIFAHRAFDATESKALDPKEEFRNGKIFRPIDTVTKQGAFELRLPVPAKGTNAGYRIEAEDVFGNRMIRTGLPSLAIKSADLPTGIAIAKGAIIIGSKATAFKMGSQVGKTGRTITVTVTAPGKNFFQVNATSSMANIFAAAEAGKIEQFQKAPPPPTGAPMMGPMSGPATKAVSKLAVTSNCPTFGPKPEGCTCAPSDQCQAGLSCLANSVGALECKSSTGGGTPPPSGGTKTPGQTCATTTECQSGLTCSANAVGALVCSTSTTTTTGGTTTAAAPTTGGATTGGTTTTAPVAPILPEAPTITGGFNGDNKFEAPDMSSRTFIPDFVNMRPPVQITDTGTVVLHVVENVKTTIRCMSLPDPKSGMFRPTFPPKEVTVAAGTDAATAACDYSDMNIQTINKPSGIGLCIFLHPADDGSSSSTSSAAMNGTALSVATGPGFAGNFINSCAAPDETTLTFSAPAGTYLADVDMQGIRHVKCKTLITKGAKVPGACVKVSDDGTSIAGANMETIWDTKGNMAVDLTAFKNLTILVKDSAGKAVQGGFFLDTKDCSSPEFFGGKPLSPQGTASYLVPSGRNVCFNIHRDFGFIDFRHNTTTAMNDCYIGSQSVTMTADQSVELTCKDSSKFPTLTIANCMMGGGMELWGYDKSMMISKGFISRIESNPRDGTCSVKAEAGDYAIRTFGQFAGKLVTLGTADKSVTLDTIDFANAVFLSGSVTAAVKSTTVPQVIELTDADDNYFRQDAMGGYFGGIQVKSAKAYSVRLVNLNPAGSTVAATATVTFTQSTSGGQQPSNSIMTFGAAALNPFDAGFTAGTGFTGCPPGATNCKTDFGTAAPVVTGPTGGSSVVTVGTSTATACVKSATQGCSGDTCAVLADCKPPFVCLTTPNGRLACGN